MKPSSRNSIAQASTDIKKKPPSIHKQQRITFDSGGLSHSVPPVGNGQPPPAERRSYVSNLANIAYSMEGKHPSGRPSKDSIERQQSIPAVPALALPSFSRGSRTERNSLSGHRLSIENSKGGSISVRNYVGTAVSDQKSKKVYSPSNSENASTTPLRLNEDNFETSPHLSMQKSSSAIPRATRKHVQDHSSQLDEDFIGNVIGRTATVSVSSDASELEARSITTAVMNLSGSKTGSFQKKHVAYNPARIPTQMDAGSPLPNEVRNFMEPRFGRDLGHVRIHTDKQANELGKQLKARAFALGSDIFFAAGQFRPHDSTGLKLIAHEITHTFQSGSLLRRTDEGGEAGGGFFDIAKRALDFAAEHANGIPGFRMFTIILGRNPINMSSVSATPANILEALIEFVPLLKPLTEPLRKYGIFEKAADWVSQQVNSLHMAADSFYQAIKTFAKNRSVEDLGRLGEVWEEGKKIFTKPIEDIKNFAAGLFNDIVKFVKDAILIPLAQLAAANISSWDLLTAVIEENPITGEKVPRNAETLIGGFMKLIHKEDVWENMQKAGAVEKAWAWFQNAMGDLMKFVGQVPDLAKKAFDMLELQDIILLPVALGKVASVFGDFVGNFITWAGQTVWKLLEIIFEVVKPGALEYVKRTGAALKGILEDPMPFVGNLVKAAKLGFQNFADNIGKHLKAALIDWLVGALPGVYIPQELSLGEIVKLVFSVLGISWQNVRLKLVKVVGEPAVKAMEEGFDIVKTLVTEGPAAAWDKIKEKISNLKDMVVNGIIDFVTAKIAKVAVPKLIAMFVPGAGFISAIVSIYDTIVTIRDRLSQIGQVVVAFVDSIVTIASGNIGPAAAKVESTLASGLSIAINVLAGFAGLGDVSDSVRGLINKAREFVDQGLDTMIDWIVKTAKKLFAKVFGKKDEDKKPDERTMEQKEADLDKAIQEAEAIMAKEDADIESVQQSLVVIKSKYNLTSIQLVKDAGDGNRETDHVLAEINPKRTSKPKTFFSKMPEMKAQFTSKNYDEVEYRRQLSMAQRTIWKMKISEWVANREAFMERFKKTGSGRDPESAKYQEKFRRENKQSWIATRASLLRKPPENMSASEAIVQATKDWEAQAALHPLDQVAGGGPKPTDMGDSAINSSIGSSWRSQVTGIYEVTSKISDKNQKKWNMNVTILLNGAAV